MINAGEHKGARPSQVLPICGADMLALHIYTTTKCFVLAIRKASYGRAIRSYDTSLNAFCSDNCCDGMGGQVLAIRDEHGREAVVRHSRP